MPGRMDYFVKAQGGTRIDVYTSGNVESRIGLILLNGLGQAACHWPSSLLSELEKVALVARMEFRGLNTPEYEPSIKDIISDIRTTRHLLLSKSPHKQDLGIYLLGYSFGGMATQLAISSELLAPTLKGFVLLATGCEFIPSAFARSFAGPGEPHLEQADLIKTVFEKRKVQAGKLKSFVDGPPFAWTIKSEPENGPLTFDWEESEPTFLWRKMLWLFPESEQLKLIFSQGVREYRTCPATPHYFGPMYLEFASTLMLDKQSRPGRGMLYDRLSRLPAGSGAFRVVVVSGSQDALFPLEHFVSLIGQMARIVGPGKCTAALYAAEGELVNCSAELDKVCAETQARLDRIDGVPGGHALLFQDEISSHLGLYIGKWLTY